MVRLCKECHQCIARQLNPMIKNSWLPSAVPISLLFGISFVACAPVMETIYRPSAPEGIIVGTLCHGMAGPKEKINFSRNGVVAGVFAKPATSAKRARLVVSIEVQEGSIVWISTNEFKLRSNSGEVTILRPKLINYYDETPVIKTMPVMAPLEGETWRRRSGQAFGRIFFIDIEFAAPDEANFYLRLPPIRINEKSTEFPEILFHREKDAHVLPLNC